MQRRQRLCNQIVRRTKRLDELGRTPTSNRIDAGQENQRPRRRPQARTKQQHETDQRTGHSQERNFESQSAYEHVRRRRHHRLGPRSHGDPVRRTRHGRPDRSGRLQCDQAGCLEVYRRRHQNHLRPRHHRRLAVRNPKRSPDACTAETPENRDADGHELEAAEPRHRVRAHAERLTVRPAAHELGRRVARAADALGP